MYINRNEKNSGGTREIERKRIYSEVVLYTIHRTAYML